MGRYKRSGTTKPFIMLERGMFFKSKEWRMLSAPVKILYPYIKAKYNGRNNGRIKLTYEELKGHKGISSPGTISKALKELKAKGWIKITRQGGLYRYSNLIELTWNYDTMN